MKVALLAGGTGGAKLGAGMQEEIGAELTVIANTADDIEVLGVHVSPDPDLVTYWLSGEIDAERGWGIREDTFTVFERLARLGAPDWFGLSDRDLAACLYRRQFLEQGGRQTDAQAQIARGLGVEARVLPMSDAPVRTKVLTAAGRRDLQEYLILDRGEAEVQGVELEGIAEAEPTAEVEAALREADAIVIGPSNPVISIGPILAVPGVREAIAACGAPVVAVSPFVAGEVVKGPTERFMAAVGRPSTAAGVASLYADLIDAMIVDEADPDPPPTQPPTLAAPTLMDSAAARARLARIVLDYAAELLDARDGR
jgi:LPPG:FO 2-phospho-L-lactate transferase